MNLKKGIRFLTMITLFGVFSSCSPELRPFTTQMMKEGNWDDADLKKIQFYLSEDIVISRVLSRGDSEIQSGKIKIIKGEKVEEVRIRRGTPGVFLFRSNSENFAVGFDAASDQRYLMFGPNPKRRGTYVLLASEWKDRQGKVRFDDKFYFTNPDAALANLLVDYRKVRRVEVSSNTVSGRKVR